MNTHGGPEEQKSPDSDYSLMMKIYAEARSEAPVKDVWPTLMAEARGGTSNQDSEEKGSRIDYILFSTPKGMENVFKPKAIRVNPYLDKEVIALSDHSAVEADFEWSEIKK